MIAALYVENGGAYYGLPNVDPWDIKRDARRYQGPHPVVAHPPCKRWGRYWSGGPSAKVKRKLGDDGGCFAAALHAARTWGGVIEHPEGSHAWRWFGLYLPQQREGWTRADLYGGWTCSVAQGNYGHRARKQTWLYVHGALDLPELDWSTPKGMMRLDDGCRSKAHRRKGDGIGVDRITHQEKFDTPAPFRDLLIEIARGCKP